MMKILVQWATATVHDWKEYDSRDWPHLPTKPIPVGGEVIDDEPGWINLVNVQGVEFSSWDHVAIEDMDGGSVRVTAWSDDEEDQIIASAIFGASTQYSGRYGQVWEFHEPAPDPAFGGRINTRQTVLWYAEPGTRNWDRVPAGDRKPWDEFPMPAPTAVKHGIWLMNDQYARLWHRRGVRGWREWAP